MTYIVVLVLGLFRRVTVLVDCQWSCFKFRFAVWKWLWFKLHLFLKKTCSFTRLISLAFEIRFPCVWNFNIVLSCVTNYRWKRWICRQWPRQHWPSWSATSVATIYSNFWWVITIELILLYNCLSEVLTRLSGVDGVGRGSCPRAQD